MTVFYQSVKISNTIISYKDLFLKQKPASRRGLKIISVEDYFLMNFCVAVPLSVVILIR